MQKATHNLQVNSISYQDSNISNNPSIRNWDLTFKLMGMSIGNPTSDVIDLAPGETKTIINSTMTLASDNTTEFTVTQPDPSKLIYRITWTDNTAPVFRTDRLLGVDTSSVITVTVNGPVTTHTSSGGTSMNTANVQIGDVLRVDAGSGVSATNQGVFTIVAKTSNSVSIQNINGGSAETDTILNPALFLAYSPGSATQASIGDTLLISGSFSVATRGSYPIQDIAPAWVQIYVGNQGGIPLEVVQLNNANDLLIYRALKNFLMIAAQQDTVVQCNGSTDLTQQINPLTPNVPEQAGLYIKMGPVWSLAIKNISLFPSVVTVNSAE